MDIIPDDYLLEEIHTCPAERKEELLEGARNFLHLVVFRSSSSRATNPGDRYVCVSLKSHWTKSCRFKKRAFSSEGTAAANPSLRNAEFKKPANSTTAIQRICRICWSGLIRDALVAREERNRESWILRKGGGDKTGGRGRVWISLVTSFYVSASVSRLGTYELGYDGPEKRIVARSKSELPPWTGTKNLPHTWLMRDVKDFRYSTDRWIVSMSFDEILCE